jgi:hypothetical protein
MIHMRRHRCPDPRYHSQDRRPLRPVRGSQSRYNHTNRADHHRYSTLVFSLPSCSSSSVSAGVVSSSIPRDPRCLCRCSRSRYPLQEPLVSSPLGGRDLPTQFTFSVFCDWIEHRLNQELDRQWTIEMNGVGIPDTYVSAVGCDQPTASVCPL